MHPKSTAVAFLLAALLLWSTLAVSEEVGGTEGLSVPVCRESGATLGDDSRSDGPGTTTMSCTLPRVGQMVVGIGSPGTSPKFSPLRAAASMLGGDGATNGDDDVGAAAGNSESELWVKRAAAVAAQTLAAVVTGDTMRSFLATFVHPRGLSTIAKRTSVVITTEQEASEAMRLLGSGGSAHGTVSVFAWTPTCASVGSTSKYNCSCDHAPPKLTVAEHCDAAARGGLLPAWMSRLATSLDPVSSTSDTFRPFESGAAKTDRVVTVCELDAPAIVPLCLRLRSNGESGAVRVSMRVQTHLDTGIVKAAGWTLLAKLLAPLFARFTALQLAAAALLGVAFLVIYALFSIASDLSKSKLGKITLASAFTAGGFLALSEGLLAAAAAIVARELRSNPYVQTTVVCAAIVSAIVSYIFLKEQLPRIVTAVFTCVEAALVCWMLVHNREATVMALVVYAVARLRWRRSAPKQQQQHQYEELPLRDRSNSPPRRRNGGFAAPRRGDNDEVVAFVDRPPARRRFGRGGSGAVPIDDAGATPRDSETGLPPVALAERTVYRGRCSNAISGRSAREKFDRYDEQGRVATRRALQQLAAHICTVGVNRFSATILDLNGLAKFAGVTDNNHGGESDDEDT